MSNYFSLGQDYTNAPWLKPMMPIYTPDFSFGAFPNFSISSPSTSAKKPETLEERKARLDKEYTHKKEIEAQSTEVSKAIEQVDESIELIKSGKKEDGSSVVTPKRKGQSFWGKALRTVVNIGKGIGNTVAGIIGFDGPGFRNWNWKKCVKNIAIAATAVAACAIPVAGPVIATGLLYAGLVAGVVSVGKGVYDAATAKTDEERDKAEQNIGAGIFVGVSSAIGLRGVGKTFRLANPSQASAAVPRTSRVGKAAEYTSNFVRDMFANTVRATKAAVSADKAAVASNGWANVYKQHIKDSIKLTDKDTKKFDKKKEEISSNIDKRLTEIEQNLQTATAQEKAFLQMEKDYLVNVKTKVNGAKSKSDWDNLLVEENRTQVDLLAEYNTAFQNGTLNISGTEFRTTSIGGNEFHITDYTSLVQSNIRRLSKQVSDMAKEVEKLSKLKLASMKYKAGYGDKFKAELDEYLGTMQRVESHWYNPKFGNEYQRTIGSTSKYTIMSRMAKDAAKSPAGVVVLSTNTICRPEQMYNGTVYSPEEVDAQLKELNAQKKQLEAALKSLKAS